MVLVGWSGNAAYAGPEEMDLGAQAAHILAAVTDCKEFVVIHPGKFARFQVRLNEVPHGKPERDLNWAFAAGEDVLKGSLAKSGSNNLRVHCEMIASYLEGTMGDKSPVSQITRRESTE